MTTLNIKRILYTILFTILLSIWCILPSKNFVLAEQAPSFNEDYKTPLEKFGSVIRTTRFGFDPNKSLTENIKQVFYPSSSSGGGAIYEMIKGITLWLMVLFIVLAGASLLLGKKPEDMKKSLFSLLYILLWWIFIYAANRLFWTVLNFDDWNGAITSSIDSNQGGIWSVVKQFTGEWWAMFVILSAIKWFAFFMAIILIVITWFKVMAAWDGDKWKKLVKWLANVVVALLIIKWVDFIYYLAADSWNFVQRASDFIINIAKLFAYIYWALIVIMVLAAWYLYMTDGWSGSNFKKASNVLVNILLSALVLFSFLLITYQIFAEFQTWGDAIETATEETQTIPEWETVYNIVDKNYV